MTEQFIEVTPADPEAVGRIMLNARYVTAVVQRGDPPLAVLYFFDDTETEVTEPYGVLASWLLSGLNGGDSE